MPSKRRCTTLGGTDVALSGWRITDDDGSELPLSGSIAANATRTITLDRGAMLSNSGDEVRLLSPTGQEHSVTYEGDAVVSGQPITFTQ